MGSGFDEVGGGGEDKPAEEKAKRKRSEIRQPGLAKAGGWDETLKRDVEEGARAKGLTVDVNARPAPAAKKDASTKDVSAALEGELLIGRVKELAALEERQIENARSMGQKLKFDVVQRKRDDAALRPDLERVVETIWVEDIEATWKRLKAALRLGVKRRNHAAVARALDDARQNAYEASCLLITTKRERERWELANAAVHAGMWNAANRVLQAEKESGLRSKQITDADVKAMAQTLFPDEWSAYNQKLRDVTLTVEALGELASMSARRAEDLQTLHGKMRG